jgi:hypothetical protein
MSDTTHNGLVAALTHLLTLAEKSNSVEELEAAAKKFFSPEKKEEPKIQIINTKREHGQLNSNDFVTRDATTMVELALALVPLGTFDLHGETVVRAKVDFKSLPVVKNRYYIVPELYVHLAKRNGRTSDDLLCYVDDVLCQIS